MLGPIVGSRPPDQPPTEEALKLKPWLLLLLCSQLFVAGLLFAIKDIWGGTMLVVVSAFGWQVYKANMDVHWCLCYGVVVLTEAIFDCIHLAIRITQIPDELFGKYMLLDIILCCAPIISMLQAYLMWSVHSAHSDAEEQAINASFQAFYNPGEQYGSTDSNEPFDWSKVGKGNVMGSPPQRKLDPSSSASPGPITSSIASAGPTTSTAAPTTAATGAE